MRSMVTGLTLLVCMAAGMAGWSGDAIADMKSRKADRARAEIRKVSKETLAQLYKAQPSARKVVERAAGYATFSNFGMKIFFAGGGSGHGLVVDKKSGHETFMNMVEVQAGLGIGVKKFRTVWVFEHESALKQFIHSGWEFGGQATAAAKASGKGDAYQGAISVAPGVWLYQLTGDALALELTAKGTKYYKNDDLN